jgi:glycine cleavage system H protein
MNDNIPQNLMYASSHEWIKQQDDGTFLVGITQHAQDALGDIVFLELPVVGQVLVVKNNCCVIESVKAASDIYAPLSGEVIAINQSLADNPSQINTSPYASWIFSIKPSNNDTSHLFNAEQYLASLGA